MVAVTLTDDVENIEKVRTDVLSELWRFYTSNKEIVNEGRRFENLFWRIWAAERIERTISGSRMGFICRTISEGENAFQQSRFHIPPLKRPPTPPTTPVYNSPGSSLPSQFSVSVLQQALMSPAMMTSPPLPPTVPPPSPAPSTYSLNMLGKDKNIDEKSQTSAAPRKSALKQDRTTSAPLPSTTKSRKKAAFQIEPEAAAPESAVKDHSSEIALLANRATVNAQERRLTAVRRGKTRGARPRLAQRTSSGSGRKGGGARTAVPQIAVKEEDGEEWQVEHETRVESEPSDPSEHQGENDEHKKDAWVVDPGFRLKFAKGLEIESKAAVPKALPTISSVQDTAVVVKVQKGSTKYMEKGTKTKYREGVEKLKGIEEDELNMPSTMASATHTLEKSKESKLKREKKSQLSLLFQDAGKKEQGKR